MDDDEDDIHEMILDEILEIRETLETLEIPEILEIHVLKTEKNDMDQHQVKISHEEEWKIWMHSLHICGLMICEL